MNNVDEVGCTVIIGMASRLPYVLIANLICLSSIDWTELKKVNIAVDTTKGALPKKFEEHVKNKFPSLNIDFFYYNFLQAFLSEKFKLPYIFSWLSWCIGINNARTNCIFLHDYDALVFGKSISIRYDRFKENRSIFQGIAFYNNNGIVLEDRIATTFEAFIDLKWCLSLKPIDIFNKVGKIKGRYVDFDTFLYAQSRLPIKGSIAVEHMDSHDLVHPTQMIHQYTMFRRYPSRKLPCYAIIILPFYNYLGGKEDALLYAAENLTNSVGLVVDLIGDNTKFNLEMLTIEQVDWMLKNMIQASFLLKMKPYHDLIEYGIALYKKIQSPLDSIWLGDFTKEQRAWINELYQPHSK